MTLADWAFRVFFCVALTLFGAVFGWVFAPHAYWIGATLGGACFFWVAVVASGEECP